MSNATADFAAALGTVLRTYAEISGPKLVNFPQGARGYQTLVEVAQVEPPSQAVLAAKLGIDRTMMTYLIDDLVEAGLVERRPNPADRRQRRIVATARGLDAVAELCEQMAEAEEAAMANLDAEERAVFRRLLSKAAGTGPVHTVEACSIVESALGAR
ncbi:MarR family winged helix-turn-helix transcriptional regulator [Actinoplanes sp. NPDC051470]|uniref:MarR family winged helix-turn-helix transcriptional regulator n=1 Tax=unclassified Actinoplanes TaxID=2626549 RepID=UPI003432E941